MPQNIPNSFNSRTTDSDNAKSRELFRLKKGGVISDREYNIGERLLDANSSGGLSREQAQKLKTQISAADPKKLGKIEKLFNMRQGYLSNDFSQTVFETSKQSNIDQAARQVAVDAFKKLGAVQDDANNFRLGGNEFRMDENGFIFQTKISSLDEQGGANAFEQNMLNAAGGKAWERLSGLGLDGLLKDKQSGNVWNFIKGQTGGGQAVQVTDEALQDYQKLINMKQGQKERVNAMRSSMAQEANVPQQQTAQQQMVTQSSLQPQELTQAITQPQGLMQQIVSDTPFQTYGTTQKYLGQDLENIKLSNVKNYLSSLDDGSYLSLARRILGF